MKRILSLLLIAVLTACTGEENIYREYECYLVFDTFLHPLPCQLTASMSSIGTFMKIETHVDKGVRHLNTTRNRRAPSIELIFLWNGNLACFSMCSHISFMAPTLNS